MIFKTESIKSNSNSIVYCLVKQQIVVCCELWEEGYHMQNFCIGEALKKGLFEEIEERIIKHALDVIILKALKNGASGGYEILSIIHRDFGKLLSAGTVYSVLYSLERNDFVRASFNNRARCYALTEKGEETLRSIRIMRERIIAITDRIL